MLFKILKELPQEANKDGSVDGKAVLPLIPLDLKDGFIHLSTKDQVEKSLEKFFADDREVYLLHVYGPDNKDEKPKEGTTGNKYRSELKWDWVESRQAYFPHLYGDLLNEDIAKVETLSREEGQNWTYA
ncbi:hypothetical protein TRVA0_031S01090 [Trichomonascus vanleenenianus]|uniref:uncharacterized protein n=1 Tax=Trichomonascus vanleenenianus TaxID=2268995 RepID=UPI003ECB960E